MRAQSRGALIYGSQSRGWAGLHALGQLCEFLVRVWKGCRALRGALIRGAPRQVFPWLGDGLGVLSASNDPAPAAFLAQHHRPSPPGAARHP
jgi:hypothetical protein